MFRAFLVACCLAMAIFCSAAPARADAPVHLRIIGGLGQVSQFVRFERPFWEQRLRELSQGRLTAELIPFDQAGVQAPELLPRMRLGVVPFATVILSIAAADDPAFSMADLPALNPDIATLRRHVEHVRPYLAQLLAERYGVELLAVYTYPAQVLFCRRPFDGLGDLQGRRIRTSSIGQSEVIEALGATPVVLGFPDVLGALRGGRVECAITGSLSGHAIGLHEVTSHVHAMALSWGLSVFGAGRGAWAALREADRELIASALTDLERAIWEGAERETIEGLACNAGQPGCQSGRPGRMQIVPASPADAAQRQRLLRETVLPRWLSRCGPGCGDAWNTTMAGATGILVPND